MYLLVPANYKNEVYWKRNKIKVADEIIERAEDVFHGVSSLILLKELATPIDIERFTSNYKGAMNGWAYTPRQIESSIIKRKSAIKGLYFTGHWVNQPLPGGIPSVAFLGKTTAKLVRNDEMRSSLFTKDYNGKLLK